MSSSSGGSTKRKGLSDIILQHDDCQTVKTNLKTKESEQKYYLKCIKIQHSTGTTIEGRSRFPKLEECAHFHYEHVELNSFQLSLYEEDYTKSSSSLESLENTDNKWLTVKVSSQGQNWFLRRTYENFRMLDQQLHQCIYDRKFSSLPELPPLENLPEKEDPQAYIKSFLRRYCERFSDIAGSLINCGPILNWLQLDNKGRRILVTDGDNCPINTPAVAAAYAIKKYSAVAADEISFDVGDMISVIDMPPPEESAWWRGKRGFVVGFFPSHHVAVITDKVPRNLPLNQSSGIIEPSKPVLRKHGKLIAFFRAFILSRPSKRHLKQSGIFRERVFGCDLGEHLLNSDRDVPRVLICCAEFIERFGIVDGIYRLSGASSNIQKLRIIFDDDRIPALYNDDSILQDIHSVASLLKMYFRELPNPLCTYQLYKNFVNAVQNTDPIRRVAAMREVVQKLPPPHFRTLEFLMRHLHKIAQHGAKTGMTARNIAIVWAPNLLRCKELEFGGVAALQDVGVQAVVTEFLISNVDLVFCSDRSPPSGISHRPCSKSFSMRTPTKLLTLEEAQNKKFSIEPSQDTYIEVGGGPSCLPKVYHTVIELNSSQKKSQLKRSPLGWKSFFLRSSRSGCGFSTLKNSSSTKSAKRKPTIMAIGASFKNNELSKAANEEMKIRLRTVKSAESLSSGRGTCTSIRNSIFTECLPPASLKQSTSAHSRSVSHDSYFNNLAESTPIHSNSVADNEGLSDLQVNFDLDDSEMMIFSEDSSQFINNAFNSEKQTYRKIPLLASAENTIIVDPSPKKHKTTDNSSCSSVSLSDDVMVVTKKRSRLEERLSNEDFAFIDSMCPDKLIVEVEVHHQESSHISSPIKETEHSENDSLTSDRTASDATLFSSNVFYTPLSESSYTTISGRVPSYQELCSSVSFSQLSQYSAGEVLNNEHNNKHEHFSTKRYSYQEEMRSFSEVSNRLSSETLNYQLKDDCSVASSSNLTKSQLDFVPENQETDTIISPTKQKLSGEKSIYLSKYPRHECENVHGSKKIKKSRSLNIPILPNDVLEWKKNCVKREYSFSDLLRNSSGSESNPGYENVRQFDFRLAENRELSSNPSVNESPYELITVTNDRISHAVVGKEVDCIEKNTWPFESGYEEVESGTNMGNTIVGARTDDDGYEEVSDSEFRNFDADTLNFETKSSYEEMCLPNKSYDLKLSPNEFSEKFEEFMIENNLYESFTVDLEPNQYPKIVDSMGTHGFLQHEDVSGQPENLTQENVKGEASSSCQLPSIYETNSFFSGFNHANSSVYNFPENFEVNKLMAGSKAGAFECNHKPHEIRKDSSVRLKIADDFKSDLSLMSASVKCPLSSYAETDRDCHMTDFRTCKKDKSNLRRSGSAKSVQDLVCIFEWSIENDVYVSKDSHDEKNKTSVAKQRNNYFSLPTVLIDCKPLTKCLLNVKKIPIDERRNKLEKRNLIGNGAEKNVTSSSKCDLHQIENIKKQEIDDHFEQNDLKDESVDDGCFYADSSLNEKRTMNDNSPLSKDNSSKIQPAITTISILYTSRKRKDSMENEKVTERDSSNLITETIVGKSDIADRLPNVSIVKCTENVENRKLFSNNGRNFIEAKSFGDQPEEMKQIKKSSANFDEKKMFTTSLERKTCKSKNCVKGEGLVAKRVSQLSKASELFQSPNHRKNGEPEFMRRRAHSTSGPALPNCIRDIAAIFENQDIEDNKR